MALSSENIIYCKECGEEAVFHLRTCHVCAADLGFPNVRHAESERDKLQERYDLAISSLHLRAFKDIGAEFESTITNNASAVLATNVGEIIRLINSDNQLYTTFANQVSSSMRIAEDNMWDRGRDAAESHIYPRYWEQIVFSVISLTGYGLLHYGNAHIKLDTNLIKKRTSIFEENPFIFHQRHNVITGQPLPKGYRAIWDDLGKLAISKLHSKLGTGIASSNFQEILIHSKTDSHDDDYIAADIYGAIHPKVFKTINFVKLDGRQRTMVNAYKDKFVAAGIQVFMVEN